MFKVDNKSNKKLTNCFQTEYVRNSTQAEGNK